MVDMRVRQKDGIQPRRIKGEFSVVQLAQSLGTLEEAAIDQQPSAGVRDEIAGAGHRAGGAAELDCDRHGCASVPDALCRVSVGAAYERCGRMWSAALKYVRAWATSSRSLGWSTVSTPA